MRSERNKTTNKNLVAQGIAWKPDSVHGDTHTKAQTSRVCAQPFLVASPADILTRSIGQLFTLNVAFARTEAGNKRQRRRNTTTKQSSQ